jgi:hypothetical protein
MNDEPDKREGKKQKQDPRKDPRQDRLKLALRENLKRRKSQARGRSGVTIAPSERDDPSPHEPGGKRSE